LNVKVRPKLILGALALAVVSVGVTAAFRNRNGETRYQTAAADRGDVVEVVGATGTLQAVTTVQVGSQVSGTIEHLYADFNSQVKRGQVIARLDPSLFQARLGQAKANLVSARANVDRSRATVVDTEQ
jgi:HlyD family secretion protein